MDHETKQEFIRISKNLEKLAGQCLAYEALFKSMKSVDLDEVKLENLLKSYLNPIGSDIKPTAEKLLKEILKG